MASSAAATAGTRECRASRSICGISRHRQKSSTNAPGFPFRSRRRVLSLRYLAADARHAPRRWRTSPPFDGLEAELPAGAAMDHPLFPVVWPS